MRFRTFVRRPVRGTEELAWLLDWVRYRRERTVRLLWWGGGLAGVLLLVNLFATLRSSGPEPVDNWWSVVLVLLLIWPVAVLAVRSLWLRPRVGAVQSELLAQRGLRSLEIRLDTRVERIGGRLEALRPRVPELEERLTEGHSEARRQIERFLGQGAGTAESAVPESAAPKSADPLALVAECEQTKLRLDAYRFALGNLEIDALLQSDYFDSPAASTAMSRALGLLRPERIVASAGIARARKPRHSGPERR